MVRRARFRERHGAVAVLSTMLLLVAFTVTACGSTVTPSPKNTKASPKPTNITLQLGPGILYEWIAYVAQHEGFFARNGLKVTFVPTSNGGVTVAGMESGLIDIGQSDLSLLGNLMVRGIKFEMIDGAALNSWELVGRTQAHLPNANQGFPAAIAGLAHRTVAVYALGISQYFYLINLLKAAGVSPSSVTIIPTGGTAQTLAAITSGKVDAAMTTPDAAAPLVSSGTVAVMYSFAHSSPTGPGSATLRSVTGIPEIGFWSRATWANAHPGAIRSFQVAMAQTDVWMHNPHNLAKLRSLLLAYGIPNGTAQEQDAMIKDSLRVIETYYTKADAEANMAFFVKNGVMSKAVPVTQWFHSGIPSNAAEVQKLATGGAATS